MIPLPPLTGELVAFVVCAPVMVLLAVGIVVARKPVHSAICMAGVMVGLAILYAAQDAPFLFVVQIIVYTGAILMLFLFVVMLIGVDSRDSVAETLRGQRVAGVLAVLGLAGLLVFAAGQAVFVGGRPGCSRPTPPRAATRREWPRCCSPAMSCCWRRPRRCSSPPRWGRWCSPTVTGSVSPGARPSTWRRVSNGMPSTVCIRDRTRTPASTPAPTPSTRPPCCLTGRWLRPR